MPTKEKTRFLSLGVTVILKLPSLSVSVIFLDLSADTVTPAMFLAVESATWPVIVLFCAYARTCKSERNADSSVTASIFGEIFLLLCERKKLLAISSKQYFIIYRLCFRIYIVCWF